MLIEGKTVRTNLPFHTFMRGAGQPEGHFIMECIMERVAQTLNTDAVEVRPKVVTHFLEHSSFLSPLILIMKVIISSSLFR